MASLVVPSADRKYRIDVRVVQIRTCLKACFRGKHGMFSVLPSSAKDDETCAHSKKQTSTDKVESRAFRNFHGHLRYSVAAVGVETGRGWPTVYSRVKGTQN